MRPSCWHKHFGPNGLSAPTLQLCLNFFSSITADFNISSALRWAVQDQWSVLISNWQKILKSEHLPSCWHNCLNWNLWPAAIVMIVSLPLTTLPSMSNEAKRLSCLSIQYSWTCFKKPPKGRLKSGLLQYKDKCCNKLNRVTRKPVYHGDFISDWTTTGLQDQHECCLTGPFGTCAGFIHVYICLLFFLPFLSNLKKKSTSI